MSNWIDSKMDSFDYSGEGFADFPCEVKISSGIINVKYKDGSNSIEYIGHSEGEGHYLLACPSVEGEATLHRFREGKILEGSWVENGIRGLWRLTLINNS